MEGYSGEQYSLEGICVKLMAEVLVRSVALLPSRPLDSVEYIAIMVLGPEASPGANSRVSGVAWVTGLIRLEIAVWARVDARLRESHELPLAFFESLLFISRASLSGDTVEPAGWASAMARIVAPS